jgi:peptidoglycan-associated lipoprotein
MTRRATIFSSLLLGLACSHAAPKPTTPQPVLTAAPRPAPHPVAKTEANAETTPATNSDAGDAIFFAYDSADIPKDARPTLQQVGKELAHNDKAVRIEGNCDERGTTEYNIALGDRRARQAKTYLERLGVSDKRISVVSYGSERPKAPGHDEAAWAKNRRDDFKIQ